MPIAQPYGVSHEGAELLVRDWMRYLGIADAEITQYSQDGGIDVNSATYVAQVKNYKGSVSVTEVRELYGVAVAEGKAPLLFTSGSVTADGVSFADRVGLALLQYDAPSATLVWLNVHGHEFLTTGMAARTGGSGERETFTTAAAQEADRLAWDLLARRGYQISTVPEWLDILERRMGDLENLRPRKRRKLAEEIEVDIDSIERLLATGTTDAETSLRFNEAKRRLRSGGADGSALGVGPAAVHVQSTAGPSRPEPWDDVATVFKQIPDPAAIDTSRLVFTEGVDADLRDLIWSALDTARETDDGVIEYFEEALRSADPKNVVFAKLHLGIISVAESPESQGWAEGIRLLSDSMRSNNANIVGRAAWHLATVLATEGGDAAQGRGRDLEELALKLNDPDALFDSSARLFGQGRRDEARDRCLRFLYPERGVLPSPGTRRYGFARMVLSACQVWNQQESVRKWFFTAQQALEIGRVVNGQVGLLGDADTYEFRGSFNVELGSASVATRLFPICPERCYSEPSASQCEHCERSPEVVTTVMAGDGDGVYPVVALLDSGSEGPPVGAIALFQGAQEGLGDRGETYAMGAALWRSAPLILGTIRSEGVVFFSDSGKGFDDANLSVDVEIEAGRGIVVAWVAPPDPEPHGLMNDGVMRPLALGVLTGTTARRLERALPKLSTQELDGLLAVMWNQPGVTVTAHGHDVTETVIEDNISYDFEHDEVRAVSWMIQSAESGGVRAARILSTSEDFLASESLGALERRGNRVISLEWWSPPPDADSSVFLVELLTANDPTATSSEVYRLAHHPSVWVRRVVAGREDLPVPAMQSLAEDVDAHVRLRLARNPATPSEVLGLLSADDSSAVRARVAMHPNIGPAVRTALERRGRFPSIKND